MCLVTTSEHTDTTPRRVQTYTQAKLSTQKCVMPDLAGDLPEQNSYKCRKRRKTDGAAMRTCVSNKQDADSCNSVHVDFPWNQAHASRSVSAEA